MNPVFRTSLTLSNEADTIQFARALAPILGATDVVALSGPVGAGKTFFARNVIRCRLQEEGVDEEVPSPTFTLVQVYQAGSLEIWHTDLYRLTNAADAFELGLEEAFETALCLVEWPDRLGEELPSRTLNLEFAQGDTEQSRALSITSADTVWRDRLWPAIDAASETTLASHG